MLLRKSGGLVNGGLVLTIAHEELEKRWVSGKSSCWRQGKCFTCSRKSYCLIDHHPSKKVRMVFIRCYWFVCLHLLWCPCIRLYPPTPHVYQREFFHPALTRLFSADCQNLTSLRTLFPWQPTSSHSAERTSQGIVSLSKQPKLLLPFYIFLDTETTEL